MVATLDAKFKNAEGGTLSTTGCIHWAARESDLGNQKPSLGAVGEREALFPEMDRKNFPDLHKASRGCGRFRLPAAWKETVRQEKRPAADTVSRFSDSDFAASIYVEPSDEMCRAFDSGFDASVRVETMDENALCF